MSSNFPNKPTGYVKFGGVKFDASQIDTKSIKTDEASGQKMYSVFLTNGTSIEYPQQTKGNKATVFIEETPARKKLVIEKMENGKIDAGKSAQDVDAKGCKSTVIDVSTVEQKVWSDGFVQNYEHPNNVRVLDYGTHISENNKVIMGKDDVSIFRNGWEAGAGIADENNYE